MAHIKTDISGKVQTINYILDGNPSGWEYIDKKELNSISDKDEHSTDIYYKGNVDREDINWDYETDNLGVLYIEKETDED